MPVRTYREAVTQSDFEYAAKHWSEFALTVSIGHTNSALLTQTIPEGPKVIRVITDDQGYGPHLDDDLDHVIAAVLRLPEDVPILVHCLAGQNRSSCLTGLVRAVRSGRPIKDCLDEQAKGYKAENPPHVWSPPGQWPEVLTACAYRNMLVWADDDYE